MAGVDQNGADDIIGEYPVFCVQNKEQNFYTFNYCTLEPATNVTITKALFKPKNQEIRLEMAIGVEQKSYDEDRAELLAKDVKDASAKDDEIFFPNNRVETLRLDSRRYTDKPTYYGALVFNGKEVHLNPIKDTFYFHPSHPHLDKLSKGKRDFAHNDQSDDEAEAGSSTAEQVTVRFKQNSASSEKWAKLAASRYKTLRAESDKEKWIECKFYGADTIASKVQRMHLYSEMTGCFSSDMTGLEYARKILSKKEDETKKTTVVDSSSQVLSIHALKAMPVPEMCKFFLKNAKILPFQQIMMTLAGGEGVTPDVLLKTLPEVAVLVKGNWVVKSEILYPKETRSDIKGVPAELMCRTRDYVLYEFTRNEYVERKKVASIMKIPSEEIKNIFQGFSKLSHNKGWELMLPTDHDFILKHGDIVQKQNDQWEERFEQLCATNEYLRDSTKRQRRKSKSVNEDVPISTTSTKPKTGPSISSDNDSGTEKNKSPVAARKNRRVKIKDSGQGNSS